MSTCYSRGVLLYPALVLILYLCWFRFRLNLLHSKAGVLRSGDVHPHIQYDFIFQVLSCCHLSDVWAF